MTQDGTSASRRSHPLWCDQSICTTTESQPYGSHLSESHVVPADPPVDAVVELHLVSTMRGLSPDTLLLLEFDVNDEPTPFPLTLRQARELHTGLDKLLATAGA
jgi:hypothetical protein